MPAQAAVPCTMCAACMGRCRRLGQAWELAKFWCHQCRGRHEVHTAAPSTERRKLWALINRLRLYDVHERVQGHVPLPYTVPAWPARQLIHPHTPGPCAPCRAALWRGALTAPFSIPDGALLPAHKCQRLHRLCLSSPSAWAVSALAALHVP